MPIVSLVTASDNKFYATLENLGFSRKDSYPILDWLHNGKVKIKDKEQKRYLELFSQLGRQVNTKTPKVLYRGFSCSREQVADLFKGKSLRLTPCLVASWTSDLKIAAKYAKNSEAGFILKTFSTEKTIFTISPEVIVKLGLKGSDVYNKNESIVKGNLIPKVTLQDLVAINLSQKIVSIPEAKARLTKEQFLP